MAVHVARSGLAKRLQRLEAQLTVGSQSDEPTKRWMIYLTSVAGQRDTPYREIEWTQSPPRPSRRK
jgi:hypothetical protein